MVVPNNVYKLFDSFSLLELNSLPWVQAIYNDLLLMNRQIIEYDFPVD